MSQTLTKESIKQTCLDAGFDAVGISRPVPQTWHLYAEWIGNQYHGEMGYLENRLDERKDPSSVLGTKPGSLIVVAKNYLTVDEPRDTFHSPIVSRYAWGGDYHQWMTEKGRDLCVWLETESAGNHQFRWCVDTAPVLERDFAAQAGIGWTGKHTNTLSRMLGNWFFLGAIITTLPLEPDRPVKAHCGTCTRCLDSCPTDAFVSPYVLDARRCISYLTIELRGSIPRELRPLIGQRIFGCDDCLAVCPWNRFASPTEDDFFRPREILQTADLLQLLHMTRDEYQRWFKGSPIKRAKYEGLKRNVAVALGNTKDTTVLPDLQAALGDESALVREHIVWAIGNIGSEDAFYILQTHKKQETTPSVIHEIQCSLNAV